MSGIRNTPNAAIDELLRAGRDIRNGLNSQNPEVRRLANIASDLLDMLIERTKQEE